ncbi:MAG: hypothetical protein IH963_08710 [Chloroflexi bacterium]|nr:hypothetical protein [Chloroflexota bacterium]
MGLLDKLKRNRKQADEDLDDLDLDLDLDEDDGDTPTASSGGGVLGRAMGLLQRGKKRSSGEEDDEDGELDVDSFDEDDDEDTPKEGGGGLRGILGKVKRKGGRRNRSGNSDPDDDSESDELVSLKADEDPDGDEQPIRRSGIAAALDGNSEEDEPSANGEEESGREGALAGLGLDLESLFEDEFVFDPTLKDLAESLDNVSAVELAADLRSFLEELQ